MGMREEVRSWLIQEKVGLLSKVDLVSLVDERISELDEPPDYLITISLGESLEHEPNLDLIKERCTNNECISIAGKMLERFQSGKASLSDLGLYTMKACQLLGEQEGIYSDFDWINDEVHLVNEGIKDRESSSIEIIKVLENLGKL